MNTTSRYRVRKVSAKFEATARYKVLDSETGRWVADAVRADAFRGVSVESAQALADMLNRDELETNA